LGRKILAYTFVGILSQLAQGRYNMLLGAPAHRLPCRQEEVRLRLGLGFVRRIKLGLDTDRRQRASREM
jgi:hypothetical protein